MVGWMFFVAYQKYTYIVWYVMLCFKVDNLWGGGDHIYVDIIDTYIHNINVHTYLYQSMNLP